MQSGKSSRLITISLLGWLLLSFPILSIVSRQRVIFGIPILFFYVFLVWLGFIFFTWLVTKMKCKK